MPNNPNPNVISQKVVLWETEMVLDKWDTILSWHKHVFTANLHMTDNLIPEILLSLSLPLSLFLPYQNYYCRSQLRKQKFLDKRESSKKKPKKPFFDFLGERGSIIIEKRFWYQSSIAAQPCFYFYFCFVLSSSVSPHWLLNFLFYTVMADDSVGVRFFFRLVVQDVEGGIKWNTEEVVLFRSKAPHSSCHSAFLRSRSLSGDSTPV